MQKEKKENIRKIQNEIDPSKDFTDLLSLPTSHVIIEKEKGYLLFSETKEECEIIMIGVIPSARQQGIGQKMLKELILKGKKIFLEVNEKNEAALRLYRKEGFKEVGRRKKYYNGQEDALLMTNQP